MAELFCARTELPDGTPLEDASEVFADKFGVDELIRELRIEYTVKNITKTHTIIASIPWKRIYTTNFDNVFETAAAQANRLVVPISPGAKIHLTAKTDPLCIHLNGFINDLDRSTIWNSFKLTDTSYSTASLENSEWATLFRQDIRFARSVFFIGYSLYDLDIKRILKADPNLNEKTFFIFHETVDAVTKARANRFGNLSKIGTEGIANLIVEGGFLNPRSPSGLSIGRSVVEYHPTESRRKPTDREFIDLLMLGEFDPCLSVIDPSAKNLYNCERGVVHEITEEIDAGKIRAAVLHSEIANGKTISASLLAESAVAKGWRVFRTLELSEFAEKELHDIAEIPGKVLLIVDDYMDWLDNIKGLTALAGERFAIILTARTNSHDINAEKLMDVLTPYSLQEFNLNSLNSEELEWWVNTLDTYGLWGDLAGSSRESKQRYLSYQCTRQIHGILLKLFDSPTIKARLSAAASDIKSDPLVENICITLFALTVLNQYPTIDTITDIWGVDVLSQKSVKNNKGLANFVDLSRSTVRVRSSAAAEYLLTNFWDAHKIVSVLLEIAQAADRFFHISIRYESLFQTLVRFGNIQNTLPEAGRRDAVISYYENLKLVQRCKTYPLFWLQYAIGALVIGELKRSERYFDTAYSLAEKRGWDKFQIDNHFARYLLVKAAEDATFDEAVVLFRKARTLVNRQIRDDKLHYPFRVASSYQAFYDRFASKFSETQLREISEAANTVASRIGELPLDRARNRYVKQCKLAMFYIREKIAAKLGKDKES